MRFFKTTAGELMALIALAPLLIIFFKGTYLDSPLWDVSTLGLLLTAEIFRRVTFGSATAYLNSRFAAQRLPVTPEQIRSLDLQNNEWIREFPKKERHVRSHLRFYIATLVITWLGVTEMILSGRSDAIYSTSLIIAYPILTKAYLAFVPTTQWVHFAVSKKFWPLVEKFERKEFAEELNVAARKPVNSDIEFYMKGTHLIAKCPKCQHRQDVSLAVGNPEFDQVAGSKGIQILCAKCRKAFTLPELDDLLSR